MYGKKYYYKKQKVNLKFRDIMFRSNLHIYWKQQSITFFLPTLQNIVEMYIPIHKQIIKKKSSRYIDLNENLVDFQKARVDKIIFQYSNS